MRICRSLDWLVHSKPRDITGWIPSAHVQNERGLEVWEVKNIVTFRRFFSWFPILYWILVSVFVIFLSFFTMNKKEETSRFARAFSIFRFFKVVSEYLWVYSSHLDYHPIGLLWVVYMYYSYLSLSGFSPQLFSMKPCEILSTKYNKRIGDSLCCGRREKFCGKVEQRGFQRRR